MDNLPLKIRFVASYSGASQETARVYCQQEIYFWEVLCDRDKTHEGAGVEADRIKYAEFIPGDAEAPASDALHLYLRQITDEDPELLHKMERASDIFNEYSTRVADVEAFVQAQERGEGLPLEDGFFAFGEFAGLSYGLNGEVEIRVGKECPMLSIYLCITENGELIADGDGSKKIRLENGELYEFAEHLEELCGTRRCRDELEEQQEAILSKRVELPTLKGRRTKPKKHRSGYGGLLWGVNGENGAIVELRETAGGYGEDCLWLLIKETAEPLEIMKVPFLPTDVEDEEITSRIAIARVNIFDVIELFEVLEPRIGPRVRRSQRISIAFAKADAERTLHQRILM
jgi:hypothetical protein